MALKSWSRSKFVNIENEIKELQKAREWELKAESQHLSDSDREKWLECRRRWVEKDKVKTGMLKQKARIKWVLDGDENSKFFHASIRRRYNKCNFWGIMIDGVWVDEPSRFKDFVYSHFLSHFSCNDAGGIRAVLSDSRAEAVSGYIRISEDEARGLEEEFSEEEIWGAIHECANNKLLSLRIRKVLPNLVGFEQSAFLRGRNIMDGALIANESFEYLKNKRVKSMIFKVDFEKAFDCLSWEF
ncbi:uncharacterized protein [Rutidosis leptorrhynchoides]|uniref:uncharacterized protein n=1 Tax=Rutidosis leptorrhynchoides TaxID=125765 RepID=UPI003A9969E8